MIYWHCPDCHKKGVHLKLKPNSEDNWQCKYCGWYFFCHADEIDRMEKERFKVENPGWSEMS